MHALYTLQVRTEYLSADCKNGRMGSDGGFFCRSILFPVVTTNRCHGKLKNWASIYGAFPSFDFLQLGFFPEPFVMYPLSNSQQICIPNACSDSLGINIDIRVRHCLVWTSVCPLPVV